MIRMQGLLCGEHWAREQNKAMLLDRGSCYLVGATACDVKPAVVCKTLHDNARCLAKETDTHTTSRTAWHDFVSVFF